MKRTAIILALLLLSATVFAADGDIITNTVFNARAVAASTTIYSVPMDLGRQFKPRGYFSLQVVSTGTGTAKITYQLSNDGSTFVTPATATDIVTAHTVGSNFYSFSPAMAKFIRIVAEETGGVNPITLTATLAVQ